ncbi:MAG TPA: proton-conducting transporter membrane subunit [Candidatus Saccharimonadales bacterium]|nr:proton-conducting transporter membrane subunit [Candidatus Saccharimonadales bacterium]
MFDAIASATGLTILMTIFGVGAVGALVVSKFDRIANVWGNGMAALGSIWGMLFAASIFASGNEVATKFATSSFSQFTVSLRVDQLAAFFIFVISLVALLCSAYGIGYVKEYYKRYNIGALGFFYNAFILGMLLVVTAANGLWFLAAWEIMSLASYFLVVYDRDSAQNIRAGFMYLVMTHVGAAFILLSLLVLYHYNHSFDFAAISAAASSMPALSLGLVFVMMFIGLGTKAGIVPLHVWLPSAHPAAPSHVSALMSGVMIKTGIYMMIRLFLDVLQPIPLWWGLVVIVAGAISSLLGVLYALTEHDIKRLLAYHSIENIGIILLGLGSALVFSSLGHTGLMLLALTASLFHTLNHATFKSLLFLSAGSMIQATHTRNIEQYGGLLKVLPLTGLFFLVGSMAISALPPFNGFFSEWLTFQALFNGLAVSGTYVQWVFIGATASLAFTGGLALACFVKAFGVSFLARPRSQAAKKAKESSAPMLAGMAGLAITCAAIGVMSSPVTHLLHDVAAGTTGLSSAVIDATGVGTISVDAITSSVSGPAVLALVVLVPLGVWFGVRYGVYRGQKVVVGKTWDCGTELNERMEITASGFSQSIVRIFGMFLRPSVRYHIEHHDPAKPNHYSLKSRTVSMHVHDLYQAHLYRPLYAGLLALSRAVRRIQSGNLNMYVLYIFVIVIIALVLGA